MSHHAKKVKQKALSYKYLLDSVYKDMYDFVVDDPSLSSGKHKTVIVMPSYVVSVTQYVKPSDLKRNLNQQFKELYPSVHITLTKIRSIKNEMQEVVIQDCDFEVASLVLSYFYFERLILNHCICKGIYVCMYVAYMYVCM